MLPNLDCKKVINRLCIRIKKYIDSTGKEGGVIGLSAGLDSTTTLYLLIRAIGRENVCAVILPSKYTKKKDEEDALKIAGDLGIECLRIPINDVINILEKKLGKMGDVDKGNITARIRMSILYNIARRKNRLVIGTGDKSEIMIGYFTKYGDGGADIFPIGSLYKTQVKRIASELGVPNYIIEKPSSPNLWRGQTAEKELGISYEKIDMILWCFFDMGWSKKKIVREGINEEDVNKVLKMVKESEHKRNPPTVYYPKISSSRKNEMSL